MPTVFVSYSRDDLGQVKSLHALLETKGVEIWRDQQNLYGGVAWPEALGRAIADQDVFVLCWSAAAAASHFVTFEWNTALALKKVIIPYLLDDTALPPALSSVNGVRSADAVLHALRQHEDRSLRADTAASTDATDQVLQVLAKIEKQDPEHVAETAKDVFEQHGWQVHGSTIINVSGDYVATGSESQQQGRLETWHAWAAFTLVVLTILGAMLDFPQKIRDVFQPKPLVRSYILAGSIFDEQREPLADVVVWLADVEDTPADTTDGLGRFRFSVTADTIRYVKLIAQKDGFRTYTADPMLDNPGLEFIMQRTP